jgi:multiple sugar transport system substrate-binding protein
MTTKIGKAGFWLAATFAAALSWTGAASAQVEIEYWQYTFAQRVQAIDTLIKQFEAANPGIKVKHTHVPYDDFRVKIAAAIPAGPGARCRAALLRLAAGLPQGWFAAAPSGQGLQRHRSRARVLSDRPADESGRQILCAADGRALAGALLEQGAVQGSGLDPERPPQTLAELVDYAKKLTKRSPNGDLLQAGLTIDMGGQDHHWLREVLIRQFGGAPYSSNNKQVAYNTNAGVAATQWYIDLAAKDKVGQIGFLTDGVTAFRSGKAAMTIDGSFRLGALDGQKGLDYGVAELPSHNGIKANFASYWVNGITTKATGRSSTRRSSS